MREYLDLAEKIIINGSRVPNRTGIDTVMIPGGFLSLNMKDGFPILTTRNIPFKSAIGESLCFLRGTTNAAEFRNLKCKYWDKNANENGVDAAGNPVPNPWLTNPYRKGEDDVGSVYGAQWRKWKAYKDLEPVIQSDNYDSITKKLQNDGWSYICGGSSGLDYGLIWYKEIDQIKDCITKIVNTPSDRRIVFHAWNLAALDEMALVPCHLLYQFIANPITKELSLCMTQRSCDYYLGAPSNIIGTSFLLHLVSHLTGYTPKLVNITFNDLHLYVNSIPAITEQFDREPMELPTLAISDRIPSGLTDVSEIMYWLENATPDDFSLIGYENHGPVKTVVPMAV